MAYVKFVNSEEYLPAIVMPTGNHTTKITTDTAPNLSGFRLYLQDNEDYPMDNGEYEKYTTLYRQGNGWYELSDDGSVYTEVAPVQPVEPTPEELAEAERQRQIADLQSQINAKKALIQSTDYQIIKTYEYSLVGLEAEYDIAELHLQRQEIRDEINDLEEELAELIIE
ncbi:MAG: hypothetical protein K6G30_12540 [Acetatifactor sp.]|nr:hypothetical protein [Acetatifactor sp.]